MKCLSRGFTLIEVLIAITILIIAISTATVVFAAARLQSEKASLDVQFSALLPLVVNQVQAELTQGGRESEHEGEGVFRQVTFKWNATQLKKSFPPSSYDVDSGLESAVYENLHLYNVKIEFKQHGKTAYYEYVEFGWPD